MSKLLEVLITTDTNDTQKTCHAWDMRTGTNLMSYKNGGTANLHSLSLLRNEFILTTNSTKPLIHIWPINSQEQISGVRFVTPGKAGAMAVSPDGNFLIIGVLEVLYIWEICSGKMLNTLSKHYQNVTKIKFTDDGSHFISAGADGCLIVWNMTYVSEGRPHQEPIYSFSDHSQPITDIHVGAGGMHGFLYSVSIDKTCRIYDLSSGNALFMLVFTELLQSIAVNLIETSVFVGSDKGSIYNFELQSPPRYKEYHMSDEDYKNFLGHKGAVTCLALSCDGEMLVSGSNDKNLHLWHVKSKQLLRTITHKGSITNIFFMLLPRNIFDDDIKLKLIATNLKKMMDPEKHENQIDILISDTIEEPPTISQNKIGTSNLDKMQEVEDLRNEILLLKKVNKNLFDHSVKMTLNNKT